MSDDQPHNVHDIIQEMMYGKDGVAKRRREAELEHERELAKIRRESHAIVWTGTSEELKRTISRWYSAGWLQADSEENALRKATIHFIRPDGSSALTPSPATLPQAIGENNPRRAFVLPLLEERGWSILDWANEAEVDHATAIDYLDNKTKPFRSSRLKLAKALKIPVEQLPK
jgi:hypothetical protein